MGDKVALFIDTNILIRHLVKTAPEHLKIRTALERAWKNGEQIWISRQIMRELANVLTRPQPYAPPRSSAEACAVLRNLPFSFQIAEEMYPVGDRLIELMETIPMGGKQVHDANIIATMLVYDIPRLFTLNTADFTRFIQLITLVSLDELLTLPAETEDENKP
jgi:predicted nucleic acid-binding protein